MRKRQTFKSERLLVFEGRDAAECLVHIVQVEDLKI